MSSLTRLHRRGRFRVARALAVLGCLGLAAAAPAQSVSVGLDGTTADELASCFGVGKAWQRGTPIALRVAVRADADAVSAAPRNVIVQWEVPNADGDIAEHRREVVVSGDRAARTWIYATPPRITGEELWTLRVFEVPADGTGRGSEIGSAIVGVPGQSVELPAAVTTIGVVGTNIVGLDQFTWPVDTNRNGIPISHDNVVVRAFPAAEIPDRWIGLSMYESIVWTDAVPDDLTTAAEESLRDWMIGGGHLVIMLPFDGDAWSLRDPGAGRLGDLMPSRAPERIEDVAVSSLVPAFTKSTELADRRDEFRTTLLAFDRLGDGETRLDPGWAPLVATDDGHVVAVQRPVGHGRLTLVGVDAVEDARLARVRLANGMSQGLLQGDAFWSRILGRRGPTPSGTEIGAVMANRTRGAGPAGKTLETRRVNARVSEARISDGSIPSRFIVMSEEAGAGLLLALVLFASYWLVAGPGGYALLRARGLVRHAWVGYVLAAAVFTGLAWGGVTSLRKRNVDVRHLTVVDWVASDGSDLPGVEQTAHASSWLSLYLPEYGASEVGLAAPDARDGRAVLRSWTPEGRPLPPSFPNPDRYAVDSGDLGASMDMPARATVTQLQADWIGPLAGDWTRLFTEDAAEPIRVLTGDAADPGLREQLSGRLISELPGTLRNVTVFWVRNDRPQRPRYLQLSDGEGPLAPSLRLDDPIRQVEVWSLPGAFETGDAIPLMSSSGGPAPAGAAGARRRAAGGTALRQSVDDGWMRSFKRPGIDLGMSTEPIVPPGRNGLERSLQMLTIFQMLEPPIWLEDESGRRPDTVRLDRRWGRRLDLSEWFVRPCVIVTGFMNEAELPIPLEVDGRRVPGEGTVMIRWIRPLPMDEALAFEEELDAMNERANAARRREAGEP